MARYTAVYAVGRFPIASWILGVMAKQMQGRDEDVDPGEAGCWGDALCWILNQMDEDNNQARTAAIAAGWMNQEGEWAA